MILKLLPEIQYKIISYLTLMDVKRLACSSTESYQVFRYRLFHAVKIPDYVFEEDFSLLMEKLGETRILTLTYPCIPNNFFKELCNLNFLIQLNLMFTNTNDRNLEVICSGIPNVRKLDIKHSRVTDDGLIFIKTLLLEELILDGCEISDKGLCHVSDVKTLRKLSFRSCYQITDMGIVTLKSLDCLKDLTVNNISDTGLKYILLHLHSLKRLDLSNSSNVTSIGFVSIKALALEELVFFFNHHVDELALTRLCVLSKLKVLDLSYCSQINDSALANIRDIPNLQELFLSHCHRITSVGISHLAMFAHSLRRLDVSNLSTNREALNYIQLLYNLEELVIRESPMINDMGMQMISKINSLKVLDISDCLRFSDEGLTFLKSLAILEELFMQGCYFTDVGLYHISFLPALRKLDVSYCYRVTDEGRKSISSVNTLQCLSV